MLSAARAQGVVEIRVHDQTARAVELEQALGERFGLKPVRVAAFRPGTDIQAATGDLAARWLDESLPDAAVLGLSWGTSLQAVVSAVVAERPRAVEVVPLVGGLKSTESLVASQVVLCFGIPFALVPLVMLTRRRDIMGDFVNTWLTTAIASVVAGLIIALNLFLVVKTFAG